MGPAPRLALAVVLLGVAGADPGARRDYASLETAVDPQGAFECPCMTAHTNATFGTMLVAKGFPATYGLQGCQAYDAKLANALTGCTGAAGQPAFCEDKWCYVDPATCAINKRTCEEAGGVRGGYVDPACRLRSHFKSAVLESEGADLFFSYQTCGERDLFSEASIQKSVAGRKMTAVVSPTGLPPWIVRPSLLTDADFEAKSPGRWKGLSGTLPKLVDAIARDHEPPLEITLLDGWRSDQSMEIQKTLRGNAASSYTACVQDVAVGKVDICISDFWVTAERLQLGASFILPYGTDDFHLVTKATSNAISFTEQLAKPWAPFSTTLWLCFFAFLLFSALVTFLTDSVMDIGDEFEDHEDSDDFDNPTLLGRYTKAVYLNTLGWVSAGPVNNPTSVPARLAALGFGWFVLIIIATYTANLAAILFESKGSGDGINSLQDAIQNGVTVCVPAPLLDEFQAMYAQATFLSVSGTSASRRALIHGKCGALLVADNTFKQKFITGLLNTEECERVDASKVPADKMDDIELGAVCKRKGGQPDSTFDCGFFKQVGDTLLAVPLSMPVSPVLEKSFSYSYRNLKSAGVYFGIQEETEKQLAGKVQSCDKALVDETEEEEDLSMPLNSLSGTFYFALFVQAIALLLGLFEYSTQKTIQEWLGIYDHYLPRGSKGKSPDELTRHHSHQITAAEFLKEMNDLREQVKFRT
eukprot:Tamp_07916.p1 GENE.Tamp_07916~~Tamp_07916.p1  ORF type:complete len:713 (+),score=98.31 Tamp_07916:42-2141(+)